MAKEALDPGLVNVGKIGRIIAVCLVLVWILWSIITHENTGALKKPAASKEEKSLSANPTSLGTSIIFITKDWSPTIPVDNGGRKKRFGCAILRDDVAYSVEYNEGPAKGGWIDEIPAKNRRPKSWEPRIHLEKVVCARIKLSAGAHVDKAPLKYTIDFD